jgi:hypothetical protein
MGAAQPKMVVEAVGSMWTTKWKGKDYLLASFDWNPLPYNPYSIKGFRTICLSRRR